jgi:hypothetical protein
MTNGLSQSRGAVIAVFGTPSERLIDLSPQFPREFGERFSVGFWGHEWGKCIFFAATMQLGTRVTWSRLQF